MKILFCFAFPSYQLQTLSVWPFSVPLNGDVFNLLTSLKTGSSILLETNRMSCKKPLHLWLSVDWSLLTTVSNQWWVCNNTEWKNERLKEWTNENHSVSHSQISLWSICIPCLSIHNLMVWLLGSSGRILGLLVLAQQILMNPYWTDEQQLSS